MLRGEFRELPIANLRLDVEPHRVAVARVRARAIPYRNDLFKPAIKELADRELVCGEVHPQHLVMVERLELLGDLLAGLPIDDLTRRLPLCQPRSTVAHHLPSLSRW